MRPHWTRFGLALLSVTLVGIAVLSIALGSWALAPGGAGAGIVGAIILAKRPRNGVGIALLAFGVVTVLTDFSMGYMTAWIAGEQLPLERVVVTVGASVFGLVGTTGCALLLVYPTGRPRGRWRWVLTSVVAIGIIGSVLGLRWSAIRTVAELAGTMVTNENSDNPEEITSAITFTLGFPLSLASLFARYRAADVVERLQIRWLMLAAGLLLVSSVAQNVVGDFDSAISQATTGLSFALFPIAIGVAIFRYRLFEIDRIISRTVSYALLAIVLAAVYIGGVIGLQNLIPASGDLPVAASTLAAAALFNPLRRRVQDWVDRRFNRRRYDAGKVVDGFGARLRDAVDLATITGDLRTVVTRTVEPVTASVWLRGEGNR